VSESTTGPCAFFSAPLLLSQRGTFPSESHVPPPRFTYTRFSPCLFSRVLPNQPPRLVSFSWAFSLFLPPTRLQLPMFGTRGSARFTRICPLVVHNFFPEGLCALLLRSSGPPILPVFAAAHFFVCGRAPPHLKNFVRRPSLPFLLLLFSEWEHGFDWSPLFPNSFLAFFFPRSVFFSVPIEPCVPYQIFVVSQDHPRTPHPDNKKTCQHNPCSFCRPQPSCLTGPLVFFFFRFFWHNSSPDFVFTYVFCLCVFCPCPVGWSSTTLKEDLLSYPSGRIFLPSSWFTVNPPGFRPSTPQPPFSQVVPSRLKREFPPCNGHWCSPLYFVFHFKLPVERITSFISQPFFSPLAELTLDQPPKDAYLTSHLHYQVRPPPCSWTTREGFLPPPRFFAPGVTRW